MRVNQPNDAGDLTRVAMAYLAALAAAALTVAIVSGPPLLEVLIADVVATVVIFGFSLSWSNSSVYDPYWSVAPPVIAVWFLALPGPAVVSRALIVTLLVLVWAVRLTANWAYGWRGMAHQDWRYDSLAESTGRFWWLVSFAGVHLFPTLVVFAGCISLYPALVSGAQPLGALDALAALLGAAAVGLEFHADRELHRFRRQRADRTQVLNRGVWAWCRHPNYLGEIGFWVSLFLFGCAAAGEVYPLSWLGPAAMLALFLGVSIPLIERKLRADKPEYTEYARSTGMLLPWRR
jgi:steroid 5-alpha reductase family enzyme